MTRNLFAIFALAPLTSFATNGYFMHGPSIKTQGMAGANLALATDAIQAVTNPAALVELDDQLELGVNLFKPNRKATISGSSFGANGNFSGNGKAQFWIPQFGLVRSLSDNLSYGIAAYANGGMNTTYDDNPFGAFGSTGRAGVDLSQLFVTGSLGYELSSGARLGVGLTHVYQKFRAEGIQSFAGMSSDPSAVSNQGYDSSTGWGIRLGWQRPINDSLTAGATWASRIDMAKLSKYQGLFAEQGGFDIPASYGFGLAAKLSPQWTLATDWEHIAYGDIKSIANPLSLASPLGSDSGGGFGWKDIDVIKVGLIHTVDETLTLRGGISHAGHPIPDDQTFFNVLAPGVIEDHISIGATWTLEDDQEISLAFTHALNNKVEGTNSIPAAFGGGDADIEMNQNTFGLSWTSKF